MSDISGDSRYDVARAKWGGSWRMPTESEFEELINQCQWEWTTVNGVAGYKVTGSNGNSIFLPAAGWRYGLNLYYVGLYAYYWSSTPYYEDFDNFACGFYFNDKGQGIGCNGCSRGQSVRPVKDGSINEE